MENTQRIKWKRVYVLRLGHRPERDKRITTHVGLVARAFGANGFILADSNDISVIDSLRKVDKSWGRRLLTIEYGVNSIKYINEWKKNGGEVIHLTMYGVNIDYVIDKIRRSPKDKLVIVGAEKVPGVIYELADYNVAIGFQPHSEVAALAIFLDKLFSGKELYYEYSGTRIRISPKVKGKRVYRCHQ